MIGQAVILAAGKGKRMAAHNDDPNVKPIPKPLLELNGRPMIEPKISGLIQNGARVCVVIHPDFEAAFRSKLGKYDISYCYQPKPLGTANSLYSAKDFVKDDLFVVMMGDDLIQYDFKKLLDFTEPTVFGYDAEDVTGYGALMLNRNGEVTSIVEKQLSGPGFVNTGVYVMPRLFFSHYKEIIPGPNGEENLTDAPGLLSKYGIRFKFASLDQWVGINTPSELLKANRMHTNP
jgi:dTDP-glucose pyrophosphorylase